jgi:hypothetical protein
MSAQSTSLWFTFAMRVNGVEFCMTSMRWRGKNSTDIEVLIRDRQLGTFSLHEDFILETGEREGEGASWRQVSLEELRSAISKEAYRVACDADAEAGIAEDRSEAPNRAGPIGLGRIPVDGDSSHVGRAKAALTHAGIRFQIVGGLDSRGRGACHLTLVVPVPLEARSALRRAGFLGSPDSKYVLVDSWSGWKLRLLQGTPRRFEAE